MADILNLFSGIWPIFCKNKDFCRRKSWFETTIFIVNFYTSESLKKIVNGHIIVTWTNTNHTIVFKYHAVRWKCSYCVTLLQHCWTKSYGTGWNRRIFGDFWNIFCSFEIMTQWHTQKELNSSSAGLLCLITWNNRWYGVTHLFWMKIAWIFPKGQT